MDANVARKKKKSMIGSTDITLYSNLFTSQALCFRRTTHIFIAHYIADLTEIHPHAG